LWAFSEQCAGLNCLLLPADASWAILFTSEDYNLIAGPSDFVQQVLGDSLQAAWTRFEAFAADAIGWRNSLLQVAARYRPFSEPPARSSPA
jgi:hypothetical protein